MILDYYLIRNVANSHHLCIEEILAAIYIDLVNLHYCY